MTIVMWAECRNGHSLNDPANVYVTPNGWRRCRICKRESDRRCRPERTPNHPPRPPYVSKRKYRQWAMTVWAEMSEQDRILLRFGLGALPE